MSRGLHPSRAEADLFGRTITINRQIRHGDEGTPKEGHGGSFRCWVFTPEEAQGIVAWSRQLR
jgi:hypothetical protein